jgi:hypothetical protein
MSTSTHPDVTAADVQAVIDNKRLVLVRWEDGSLEHLTDDKIVGHPDPARTVTDDDGVTGRIVLTGTSHDTSYGDHDVDSPTYAADLAETVNLMQAEDPVAAQS